MRGTGGRDRNNEWGARKHLLNFAKLFVARIFAGQNQFGKTQDIFYVPEIGGLGERFLDDGILNAKQLLNYAALLRF